MVEAHAVQVLQPAQRVLALATGCVQVGVLREDAFGTLVETQVGHRLPEVLLERGELALAFLPARGNGDERAGESCARERHPKVGRAELRTEDEDVGHARQAWESYRTLSIQAVRPDSRPVRRRADARRFTRLVRARASRYHRAVPGGMYPWTNDGAG